MFKAKIFAVAFALLLLSSCAQMAPPVPPSLELPKAVTDLKVVRKGDKVYLRWTLPAQTTDGESVSRFGITRICRSFDSAAKQCEEVGKVAPVHTTKASTDVNTPVVVTTEANYTDTLSADVQSDPAKILSYTVSLENESGRSAGLSNRVQVPAAATLAAPADFNAQVTADGVVLRWTAISVAPALHSSYRIYRRQEGTTSQLVAGEFPLGATTSQFVDHGFEWGKTYFYRMTLVTEISGGMHACGTPQKPQPDCATVYQVEGDDSPLAKVVAEDLFPPAVPSGLQAVYSGEGQKAFVDLVWSPDIEGDLAGYNVYRREEGGKPVKVNAELAKPPAYRDTDVASGKKYFYSVTAVDLRGNESGRSEEASESVP
jgi:hypothetical protein